MFFGKKSVVLLFVNNLKFVMACTYMRLNETEPIVEASQVW